MTLALYLTSALVVLLFVLWLRAGHAAVKAQRRYDVLAAENERLFHKYDIACASLSEADQRNLSLIAENRDLKRQLKAQTTTPANS